MKKKLVIGIVIVVGFVALYAIRHVVTNGNDVNGCESDPMFFLQGSAADCDAK